MQSWLPTILHRTGLIKYALHRFSLLLLLSEAFQERCFLSYLTSLISRNHVPRFHGGKRTYLGLESVQEGFPGGSDEKQSACSVGGLCSVPGLGRSPGGGRGNPLQYSCLENPTDRGAWQGLKELGTTEVSEHARTDSPVEEPGSFPSGSLSMFYTDGETHP